MGKFREAYVVGCLAEQDTSEPFDGATLFIEKAAFTEACEEIKKLRGALEKIKAMPAWTLDAHGHIPVIEQALETGGDE